MLAKGITIDISDGGVFVCTAYKIPVGELLQLAIALPGGGWLKARGEVRWARAASQGTLPGVGIAFAYVSPIDRAMIDRFLN